MPKISIITITYNRAKFLPEAIESVLAQTFKDWELLIVDDCSMDNTKEVTEKYVAKDSRIKYFRNEVNLKISKSRNRGLDLAQGKYVAMLDSDDVWCDNEKLEKQYNFLENKAGYALMGGGVIIVDENGKEIKRYLSPIGNRDLKRNILVKNPFAQSSIMYPRQVALDLGGYDINLSGIEDYDLWLRIGKKYKIANLHDYVLKYRIHGSNISLTDRARLMERNLFLVNRYKNYYPNYWKAVLRRIIRLYGYKIISLIKK